MKKYPYIASIIIPTRNRSKLLKERLEILKGTTQEIRNGTAEVILVTDTDDPDSHELVKDTDFNEIQVPPLTLPCIKWNRAAYEANGKWLVTVSDDCIPQLDWLTNALNMLNYGFMGLPDGVTGERNQVFTPLYMATREWLKEYNGGVLVLPVYKSWYADIETCARAKASNTYVVAHNSVLLQLHKDFKSAPDDEIYKIGESRRMEDLKTFSERQRKNFPNDFERIF